MPRAVIKVGSQVLCEAHGGLNAAVLGSLAAQVADLAAEGWQVLLVTSGAVASGAGIMRSDKKRYGSLHFGIGTGPDRYTFTDDPGKRVFSTLRLEGIIARVTVIVDDNIVVCENGEIKV